MSMAKVGRGAMSFRLHQRTMTMKPFETVMAFDGSNVMIEQAELSSPEIQAYLSGPIKRVLDSPMLGLSLKGSVNLDEAIKWVPPPPVPVTGMATIEGTITGPARNFSTDLVAHGNTIAVGRERELAISGPVKVTFDAFSGHDFKIKPRTGGVIRARDGAHELAASQDADPIADGPDLCQLVADEHNRQPIEDQRAQGGEQRLDLIGHEHGGGLVEDEDSAVAGESLEDLNALLLSDRQPIDARIGSDSDPEALRRVRSSPTSLVEVEAHGELELERLCLATFPFGQPEHARKRERHFGKRDPVGVLRHLSKGSGRSRPCCQGPTSPVALRANSAIRSANRAGSSKCGQWPNPAGSSMMVRAGRCRR